MSSPDEYDVVVVGGRLAGTATAMLLARRGVRVLVLDRARRGTDTLSTHAFMRGGVLQLHRWGLLDKVAAAGTPAIRGARFHYHDEAAGVETVAIDFEPVGGVDALYAPRRTVLDAIVVDAAVQAGAEVRFGTNVTALDRGRDGRVAGVSGRDDHGHSFSARGRLIVGADGMRSFVARTVEAPVLRTGEGAGAVVYGRWALPDVEGYEWFYRPGAAAGFIPTNGGEVVVFAGTSNDRFRGEIAGDIRAGYLRLLKEVVGDRVSPSECPDRLWTFPGMSGFIRQPWGAGWALVGDAASFTDPLSAHGMTDALRDAELLAQAATAVLAGEDETAAMTTYQERREQVAGPVFSAADCLATYRWTMPEVKQALLDLSKAMKTEHDVLTALGN